MSGRVPHILIKLHKICPKFEPLDGPNKPNDNVNLPSKSAQEKLDWKVQINLPYDLESLNYRPRPCATCTHTFGEAHLVIIIRTLPSRCGSHRCNHP